MTGGIFYLVCTWNMSVKAWAFYNRTQKLVSCTHILVFNSDGTQAIVPIDLNTCVFKNRYMKY